MEIQDSIASGSLVCPSTANFSVVSKDLGNLTEADNISSSPNVSSEFIQLSVVKQFDKEFTFGSTTETSFPPMSEWFTSPKWHDSELLQLREDLNAVKNMLNDKPLQKWHNHTRRQNPAGLVVSHVRKVGQPELLTQAWCKLTECLQRYQLVKEFEDVPIFVSTHLCEAPGAFVTALNYHLKTNYSAIQSWEWTATTLNPYYEGNATSSMINDDRFILHTIDRWFFGHDNTGDIFVRENLNGLVHRVSQQGGAHLITADGSIDCQSDPARQEEIVAPLHMAEVVAALSCLVKGGHFVLKMFTLFEADSVCLMFLLNKYFANVNVFKPATSKEGNSEVYVVCRSFLGIEADHLNKLSDNLGGNPEGRVLFSQDQIPETFMQQIRKCCSFFVQLQCDVIKRNIEMFTNHSEAVSNQRLRLLREAVAAEFIRRNKILLLPRNLRILPNERDKSAFDCVQMKRRNEEGTFSEKWAAKKFSSDVDDSQRLMNKVLTGMKADHRLSWTMQKVQWQTNVPLTSSLTIQFGRPILRVSSSKFCSTEDIQIFDEVVSFRSKNSSPTQSSSPSTKTAKRRRMLSDKSRRHKPISTILLSSEESTSKDKLVNQLVKLYPEIVGVTHLLNFSLDDNQTVNYLEAVSNDDNFLHLLDSLIQVLKFLPQKNHLIVKNFPLLTRKYVALLRIVAESFEEIAFVRPIDGRDAIFFSNLGESVSSLEMLNEIRQACFNDVSAMSTASVVELVPIKELTVEPFYSLITAHNLNVLRSRCLEMLNSSKKSFEFSAQ